MSIITDKEWKSSATSKKPSKVVNQKGFNFGWKSLSVSPTINSDGYCGMRLWQKRAFEQLKDPQHVILNAPMGSGKSKLMCWISAYRMKKDASLKCLIAVPQTNIGDGFLEEKLQMPDGENLHWFAQHDLCNDQPVEGNVKAVISWLKTPHGFLQGGVLVCTHATLVFVYKTLKESNELNLLKDLLVWIDEAHHVKNTSVESMEGFLISNGIGELVKHLMAQPDVQLGLATASFFRGDRMSIVTEEMNAKFSRFDLPLDEYLEQLQHLKSFSFDFVLCGKDFTKPIELLAKQRKGKDIVYIPHPMSKDSTKDKYREVRDIVGKYQKVHGKKSAKQKDLITVGDFKIIDLVDDLVNRAGKKEYIRNIKNNKNALDAIITLGMFKEGANWIWADRGIIIGARSSLLDIFQMIGRVFRDAEGKSHVEIIQVLPFSLDQTDEEEFRENLNNYLKAVYASLILENIFKPVKIKTPPSEKEKGENGRDTSGRDYLSEALGDVSSYHSLVEEVGKKLIEINANKENVSSISLWDEYQKALPEILNNYGVNLNIDKIGKQIWGMFARRSLRMQGIDVDDIDFDIVQKGNPLEFLLNYTSNSCNVNTFKELRDAIKGKNFISYQELREIIHKMRDDEQPLNTVQEYEVWRKISINKSQIPSHPAETYRNEWEGWAVFLGNKKRKSCKNGLPFTEAKEIVRKLKFKSSTESKNGN
jgi:superfamily II DNA or RNA helicase